MESMYETDSQWKMDDFVSQEGKKKQLVKSRN